MIYIEDDLDYIFIRALNSKGKWDNLSLNEITNDHFIKWIEERMNVVFETKNHVYTKQDKIDVLNYISAKCGGAQIVTMIKREARKNL